MDVPSCPKCKAIGIGDRCAHCGADMQRAPSPALQATQAPALQFGGEAPPAAKANPLGRTREAAVYLKLQPSETAVLQAAAQIVAGFAAAGTLTPDNEQELSDRAVRLAARMAVVIERYVQSDDEDW